MSDDHQFGRQLPGLQQLIEGRFVKVLIDLCRHTDLAVETQRFGEDFGCLQRADRCPGKDQVRIDLCSAQCRRDLAEAPATANAEMPLPVGNLGAARDGMSMADQMQFHRPPGWTAVVWRSGLWLWR